MVASKLGQQRGLRLKGDKILSPDKKKYVRQFAVNDTGTLDVSARDLAGNIAKRRLDFSLLAKVDPTDDRGPAIVLRRGDKILPVEEHVFFWQKTDDVVLEIADPAGIDLDSLQLTSCRLKAAIEQGAAKKLRIPLLLNNNPSIKVRDLQGHETWKNFNVQVVAGPARLTFPQEQSNSVLDTLPPRVPFFNWRAHSARNSQARSGRSRGETHRFTQLGVWYWRQRLSQRSPGSCRRILDLRTLVLLLWAVAKNRSATFQVKT